MKTIICKTWDDVCVQADGLLALGNPNVYILHRGYDGKRDEPELWAAVASLAVCGLLFERGYKLNRVVTDIIERNE